MRTLEDVEAIAKRRGWKVNEKAVNGILRVQNKFKKELGEYYCPCKKDHIPENVCPCLDAPQEIERDGHCHCNLFLKA